MAPRRICAVQGCGKPHHAHGYCPRHAYHWKTHGDPTGGRRGASPGAPLKWIDDHVGYEGDDCIKWPFEIGRYGYGTVKEAGKKRVASRVMCERAHGPPPSPDMEAAHSCGRGHQACMNRRHLSWKTKTANVREAMAHGTWKHGEMDPGAKLTEADIREIRLLYGELNQYELAEKFGVRQQQISRIINRKQWAWVDNAAARLLGPGE